MPRSRVERGPIGAVPNVYRTSSKVSKMEEHWIQRKGMEKVRDKIKSSKWNSWEAVITYAGSIGNEIFTYIIIRMTTTM